MASSAVSSNPIVKPPQISVEKGFKGEAMPADDQSREESVGNDLEKQPSNSTNSTKVVPESDRVQDGPAYPPMRDVIIIMPALYLAMFLQALVSAARHKRETLYVLLSGWICRIPNQSLAVSG